MAKQSWTKGPTRLILHTAFVITELYPIPSHLYLPQVDHDIRKSWDAYAGDMAVVDTDTDTDSKLIHWIMKYPVSDCEMREGIRKG